MLLIFNNNEYNYDLLFYDFKYFMFPIVSSILAFFKCGP